MFKSLLIVLLCLLSATATQAQVPATAAPRLPATRTDTVQAVHKLFRKHRTGGWIWTSVGTAFAVRIISVAATTSSDAASGTPAGTAIGVAILGGVPASIGVGKLTRYSTAKEQQVVELYTNSGLLPPYVAKRLKGKYFSR